MPDRGNRARRVAKAARAQRRSRPKCSRNETNKPNQQRSRNGPKNQRRGARRKRQAETVGSRRSGKLSRTPHSSFSPARPRAGWPVSWAWTCGKYRQGAGRPRDAGRREVLRATACIRQHGAGWSGDSSVARFRALGANRTTAIRRRAPTDCRADGLGLAAVRRKSRNTIKPTSPTSTRSAVSRKVAARS